MTLGLNVEDLASGFEEVTADALVLVNNVENGIEEFSESFETFVDNVVNEVEDFGESAVSFVENTATAIADCFSSGSNPIECYAGVTEMKSLLETIEELLVDKISELQDAVVAVTDIESISNLIDIDALTANKEEVQLDGSVRQTAKLFMDTLGNGDVEIPESIDIYHPDFSTLINEEEFQQRIDVITKGLTLTATSFMAELAEALESTGSSAEVDHLFTNSLYAAVGVKWEIPMNNGVVVLGVELQCPLPNPQGKLKVDVYIQFTPIADHSPGPQGYLNLRTGYSDATHSFGFDFGLMIDVCINYGTVSSWNFPLGVYSVTHRLGNNILEDEGVEAWLFHAGFGLRWRYRRFDTNSFLVSRRISSLHAYHFWE